MHLDAYEDKIRSISYLDLDRSKYIPKLKRPNISKAAII